MEEFENSRKFENLLKFRKYITTKIYKKYKKICNIYLNIYKINNHEFFKNSKK